MVSKTKKGCALLDLDFIAAFDYHTFAWVFLILRVKGVYEEVITRLQNIYSNRVLSLLSTASLAWQYSIS